MFTPKGTKFNQWRLVRSDCIEDRSSELLLNLPVLSFVQGMLGINSVWETCVGGELPSAVGSSTYRPIDYLEFSSPLLNLARSLRDASVQIVVAMVFLTPALKNVVLAIDVALSRLSIAHQRCCSTLIGGLHQLRSGVFAAPAFAKAQIAIHPCSVRGGPRNRL